MSKPTLKAREVEALTFIYTATPSRAGVGPGRRPWRPRPRAVGLAVVLVALAALACMLLPA